MAESIKVIDLIHKEDVFFSGIENGTAGYTTMRIAYEQWGSKLHFKYFVPNGHILLFCMSGKGTFRAWDHEWHLGTNSLFSLIPGKPHEFFCDPESPLEVFLVWINGKNAAKLLRRHLGSDKIVSQAKNAQNIVTVMNYMLTTATSGTPLAQEICDSCIPVLMKTIQSDLMTANQDTSGASIAYFTCKTYMERHAENCTSIAEVAKANRISEAYLCRLFKRQKQISPYKYLMNLKINKAGYLLTSTNHTIKEIAHQLHFSDAFTFSKVFKRITGKPPIQFRQGL